MNVAPTIPHSTALARQAFARALRDPGVVGAAAAMNVDLSDRRTLLRLAARARAVLALDAGEAEATGTATHAVSEADLARLSAISNHHARAAIRTYLEISRMA